jgi:eukaryotic-like serine/threonine-protein kinase
VTQLPTALQEGLADRYTIERELGRGGMATVYLAVDVKHDRPVALKVLHPDLAATLGPERFTREIRMAARLQHPHILSVHDSGETAGHLWFTMPFVEGESLRDRLNREKQLPIEDAVRLARETALALDFAHRHGVVHRDIKPENILLMDGQALVADFGIARALSGASVKLTGTGMSIGTPAYMSPEQAAGEQDVDGRSDVYSLGCVLFEMLAGEPPHSAPTMQGIIARRLSGEIPSVRRARSTVPPAVDEAISRAMALIPADRFSTPALMAAALADASASTASRTSEAARPTQSTPSKSALPVSSRRISPALTFVLGLLVTATAGTLIWQRTRHVAPVAEGTRLLAVLPFENLGDSSDIYFADGVTDEVRGKLASLPKLQVIATGSANQYRNTTKTPQQIGQELGVEYLLVGKIRWVKSAGGTSRVRVSPELIQVANVSAPTTRWQQPFDAELTDVFKVQADIAAQVAQALGVALGSGEQKQLADRPTENLEAYDAYLRGEEISAQMTAADPATLRRAAAAYEQAVALDSTFVAAWSRLSFAHSLIFANGTPTTAEQAKARQAAERALAVAPGRPEGRLALAEYYRLVERNNPKALEQAAEGEKVAPGHLGIAVSAALAEQSAGEWERSRVHLEQAMALDPRSVQTAYRLTRTLLYLRRYDEAMKSSDRVLALSPTNVAAIQNRAMIHIARGDLAAAQSVVRSVSREVDPTSLVSYFSTYNDLFWLLDESQQQLLLRLTPVPFDDDRASWGLALAGTYAHRGDQARARAYADSARIALEAQIREAPNDRQLHTLLGTALAYLGRRADAIREGERGANGAIAADAFLGPYSVHQLARIYTLLGEPDKAVDQLEAVLEVPYMLSAGWLRVDPTFAPLRGHPRYERLAAGG